MRVGPFVSPRCTPLRSWSSSAGGEQGFWSSYQPPGIATEVTVESRDQYGATGTFRAFMLAVDSPVPMGDETKEQLGAWIEVTDGRFEVTRCVPTPVTLELTATSSGR